MICSVNCPPQLFEQIFLSSVSPPRCLNTNSLSLSLFLSFPEKVDLGMMSAFLWFLSLSVCCFCNVLLYSDLKCLA